MSSCIPSCKATVHISTYVIAVSRSSLVLFCRLQSEEVVKQIIMTVLVFVMRLVLIFMFSIDGRQIFTTHTVGFSKSQPGQGCMPDGLNVLLQGRLGRTPSLTQETPTSGCVHSTGMASASLPLCSSSRQALRTSPQCPSSSIPAHSVVLSFPLPKATVPTRDVRLSTHPRALQLMSPECLELYPENKPVALFHFIFSSVIHTHVLSQSFASFLLDELFSSRAQQ